VTPTSRRCGLAERVATARQRQISAFGQGFTRAALRHPDTVLTDDVVASLAAWSPWLPFEETAISAPRLPGAYLARKGSDGGLVYVGMAGERRGQGLRGRLTVCTAEGKLRSVVLEKRHWTGHSPKRPSCKST
jgi:hypothetical protein